MSEPPRKHVASWEYDSNNDNGKSPNQFLEPKPVPAGIKGVQADKPRPTHNPSRLPDEVPAFQNRRRVLA